jgi:hypothetical protein
MIVCMRCLHTLMMGLIMAIVPAVESFAPAAVDQAMPQPNAPPQNTPVHAYIITFVLLVLVSFAAMKSCKRTHQD